MTEPVTSDYVCVTLWWLKFEFKPTFPAHNLTADTLQLKMDSNMRERKKAAAAEDEEPKAYHPSLPTPPKQTQRALFGLLLHSIAMVCLPFIVFYGTVWGYTDPLLKRFTSNLDSNTRNTFAAVFAVIAVNVVVGNFVFRAFKDEDEVKPSSKPVVSKKAD